MKTPFDKAVKALREVANRFDAEADGRKLEALRVLRRTALVPQAALLQYHDTLLFTCAHPPDAAVLTLVERELQRLSAFMKAHGRRQAPLLQNEGLPFAATLTRFSHDGLRWLLAHPHCRITPEPSAEPSLDLNAVLRLTLPSLEWNETTASLGNDELLDALQIAKTGRLAFIVNELSRFDGQRKHRRATDPRRSGIPRNVTA